MPTLTAAPPLPGRVFPDDYPPVNVRSLVLRPIPQDVRTARRFIGDYCDSRGISETVRDDAMLCGTETFTNAVKHARFPAGRCHVFLRVHQLGPFMSVTVFDPDVRPECLALLNALLAVQGPAAALTESGRGLSLIVRPLACRLAVGLAPHRLKAMTFEVDCLPSKSF